MAKFVLPTETNSQYYGFIEQVLDWDSMIEVYKQLQGKVTEKVLLLLDDIPQCNYTSMHASSKEELYFDWHKLEQYAGLSDEELDKVDEAEIEPLEIAFRINQIQKCIEENSVDEMIARIASKTECYDSDDFKTLSYINQNPFEILFQEDGRSKKRTVAVKLADVATDSLKIAIQPNGYFADDIDTFENYFVITTLTKFGYEFIGLGASMIYFIKTNEYSNANDTQIIEFISKAYSFSQQAREDYASFVSEKNHLVLPFTEQPEEYLDFYE